MYALQREIFYDYCQFGRVPAIKLVERSRNQFVLGRSALGGCIFFVKTKKGCRFHPSRLP